MSVDVLTSNPANLPAHRARASAGSLGSTDPADALSNLADLPAVDLAGLCEHAGLMTRLDRKYVVDLATVPKVLAALRGRAAALDIDDRRVFAYRSVYFDTPTLTSYLLAARRRPRRFKVRTRTYVHPGTTWLEVKVRDGRGQTAKSRVPWTLDHHGLNRDGRDFVASELAGTVAEPIDLVDVLGPELTTTYQRATLLLPGDAARVTIDTELAATHPSSTYGLHVPGVAIIETKTSGRPCAADRALWALGIRPMRVSKYATLMAALHPALPAHRWRPALRRIDAAAHRAT